MRKVIEDVRQGDTRARLESWLDVSNLASAELSSEDPEHPLENALNPNSLGSYRAAMPGPQRIRLTFDTPLHLRRIRLEFEEHTVSRSQEFALFTTATDGVRRELLRQQWTFSPGGSTHEREDYTVDLRDIHTLELAIDPGRHQAEAFVTLETLAIA